MGERLKEDTMLRGQGTGWFLHLGCPSWGRTGPSLKSKSRKMRGKLGEEISAHRAGKAKSVWWVLV